MKNVYLLIGTQKAGTTSLYTIFKGHPQINCANKKESEFFFRNELYQQGIAFYKQNFFAQDKPGQPYLDIDPNFMFYDFIAERIYHTLGQEAKFIVILRDPSERAYSNYLMEKARKNEALPFLEAIKQEPQRMRTGKGLYFNSYIKRSLYTNQLQAYLKFYPIEHFKFFLFEEDFVKNRKDVIQSICDYMHVTYDSSLKIEVKTNARLRVKSDRLERIYKQLSFGKRISKWVDSSPQFWKRPVLKINNYLSWKLRALYIKINISYEGIEELSQETRRYLIHHHFLDEIERLEKLIGRDLSLWKKY